MVSGKWLPSSWALVLLFIKVRWSYNVTGREWISLHLLFAAEISSGWIETVRARQPSAPITTSGSWHGLHKCLWRGWQSLQSGTLPPKAGRWTCGSEASCRLKGQWRHKASVPCNHLCRLLQYFPLTHFHSIPSTLLEKAVEEASLLESCPTQPPSRSLKPHPTPSFFNAACWSTTSLDDLSKTQTSGGCGVHSQMKMVDTSVKIISVSYLEITTEALRTESFHKSSL